MKEEIWKEVMRWRSDNMPETTDCIIYVSNFGRIKRNSFVLWCEVNNSYSVRKEHIYALSTNRGKQRFEKYNAKKGMYQSIKLKNKSYSVHRLVAQAFIPNPENKPQVNHKDGNRANNHVDNLEWVTNDENQKHAKEVIGKEGIRGSENKSSKLTEKDIPVIREMLKNGYTKTEIAKRFNLKSISTITWIAKGKTWSHVK